MSNEIVSALDSLKISNVAIGIEATSIYGEPLIYSLREDGNLGQFSPTIYVLNPKQVRKFRESYLVKDSSILYNKFNICNPPLLDFCSNSL